MREDINIRIAALDKAVEFVKVSDRYTPIDVVNIARRFEKYITYGE